MKLILSIILTLSAGSALATNYVCEKQVTPERIEGALVSTGRYNMNISLTSRECASSYCTSNREISIMNNEVLFNEGCKSTETPMSIDVSCASGKELSFYVNELGAGQIIVSQNSQLQIIELGQCRIN